MSEFAPPNVLVRLPGAAVHLISDGNWRTDNPAGWDALQRGHWYRVGRGTQLHALLTAPQADDLAAYLESVAGVVGSMTSAERDGGRERQTASAAARRIREVRGAGG